MTKSRVSTLEHAVLERVNLALGHCSVIVVYVACVYVMFCVSCLMCLYAMCS